MSKTTATKTTRKAFAPSILAQAERIKALSSIPANDAFRQLLDSAEKIAGSMSIFGTRESRLLWEGKEEEFLSRFGMSWDEALSLQEEIEAGRQKEKPAGKTEENAAPAALPGLTEKDIAGLRRVYSENPAARVPGHVWKKAFSGACASRRAGLDFRTWATRSTALPRPVVADIAFRVWSLPENELIGNAPVRPAF